MQLSAFLWRRRPEIRTTSPVFLSCVLNPPSEADESEQDRRHDEVHHKRNDPGRFLEDLFQPQCQENSG